MKHRPTIESMKSTPVVTPYVEINPALIALRCIRCDSRFPLVDLPRGCPSCAAAGVPASLACVYSSRPSSLAQPRDWLAYRRSVNLGEGHTPQIDLPYLAKDLGIRRLTVKNEAMNPTGSHKDRMSSQAVSRALDIGAGTVVLASSGNAAVSAATYCAAAGLICEIATYGNMPAPYVRELSRLGAIRVQFAAAHQRWLHVRERVERDGAFALTNFNLPAVGSPVFGVDAFKAVAIECAADGPVPEHVVVPSARGDLLWGLHEGFVQLASAGLIERPPKLWAVEPFARLSRVLEGACLQGEFAGSTEQFSIAGSTVTYQLLRAVQDSGGGAVVVPDEEARRGLAALAQEGLHGELCTGATVSGLKSLIRQGAIRPEADVMLLFTARGERGAH
ncbi:MAG: pyridoxal-phosphate dependent enzyme [Pseudomonadota bacterium]